MPFPPQVPTPFTKAKIEALNPNQYGCYGLSHTHWVYVGKGDIRERLLAHLNGDNACITRERPTNFWVSVTSYADTTERALIAEFTPTCNQRVG